MTHISYHLSNLSLIALETMQLLVQIQFCFQFQFQFQTLIETLSEIQIQFQL